MDSDREGKYWNFAIYLELGLNFSLRNPLIFLLIFAIPGWNLWNLLKGRVAEPSDVLSSLALSVFMIVVLTAYIFKITRYRWLPFVCIVSQVVQIIIFFASLYAYYAYVYGIEELKNGVEALIFSVRVITLDTDFSVFDAQVVRLWMTFQRIFGALYLPILAATFFYLLSIDKSSGGPGGSEPGFGKIVKSNLKAVPK